MRTCEYDCESHEDQCGARKHRCGVTYWRQVIERRHLEEEALLDRRRRDLDGAIGPTVPKTLKGPDAPTESERTAYEIPHLPPAPWCRSCTLGRGIETPTCSLRWNVKRGSSSLWTISRNRRLEHWMRVSDSVRDRRSHRLPLQAQRQTA